MASLIPRAVVEVDLPLDEQAEHSAAAIAVMSAVGAARMVEISDDIYDPRVQRVIRLAHERDWRHGEWMLKEAELVAAFSDVPAVVIRQWINGCPLLTDDNSTIRDRIRRAAVKRREVQALLERLEAAAA